MDVAYWRRNRDEQYRRVESMMHLEWRRQMRLELIQTLAGLLEHSRYDSHYVHKVEHDGRGTLWVDIKRPGGTHMTVKLLVEVD
jgi:hypothetical protein